MKNKEYLETAFLQLSFAIKLWHFLDIHKINKDLFDIALTIEEQDFKLCLPSGEFNSYNDLQVASANNVSIAFGSTAITLWEAIREHSKLSSGNLNPTENRVHNIASLSYMIRCCFAHGFSKPIWDIKNPKYRTFYHVGNKTINLSNTASGEPFGYSSIGGYETLWMLKNDAIKYGAI